MNFHIGICTTYDQIDQANKFLNIPESSGKLIFFSYFFRQVVEVEKQPKTIVIPRYQPIFVEPNMKEYETQVLQMSVPIDDSERYSDPK